MLSVSNVCLSFGLRIVLVRFQQNLKYFDNFSKKFSKTKFHEIRPVGAELFHADGQTGRRTDVAKLMVAFRNFANAR